MAIYKRDNSAKAKISLRKVKDKEEWSLCLEISRYRNSDYAEPTTKVEYLGMNITTPVFNRSTPIRVSKNGVTTYAPILDSRGVVICTSIADQKKCDKAETIRKERQAEIDRDVIYTQEENILHQKLRHGDEDFIAFFEEAIPRMHPGGAKRTLNNWNRCLIYLKDFAHQRPLLFKNLNMELGNDFKTYLLKHPAQRKGFEGATMTPAAASTFFSIFKAALKQAFIEDYLSVNLGAQLKGITAPRPKRETLDLEELRLLSNTPCRNNWVKRTALFTALTGLRHSDVKEIKWNQFKKTPTGWRLDFVQKKTGMPEYLPLSEQAYSLCGEPGNPIDFVFKKLPEMQEEPDGVTGATMSSQALYQNMQLALLQVADADSAAASASSAAWMLSRMAVLLVVALGCILPLFSRFRKYRTLWLCINVAVLGLWGGTFISHALLVNWLSNGTNLLTSLAAVFMLTAAFIYPFFGKKSYYCTWICPLGSLQELAGKLNKKSKWKLSPKTVKMLNRFNESLWAVLMLLMLTGVWFDWMDYELFTAFLFTAASPVVIALAAVFIILSVFVPRPYCRFVCPTGCLFRLAQNEK